ncbi:MAG: radical SAM protein [Candidatus Helarchaeota archaeon]
MSKSKKITLGTKEWADSNVNCFLGCSNDCRYCYAKKMAIRFKRKTEDTWKIMEPNLKSINKRYNKRTGRIMFPTSHDITKESIEGCLIVLKKLLTSGNEVLITTKPNLDCIKRICEEFDNKKHLIQFRFTITSINNEILKFWEPGAPTFEERFKALKYTFKKGFKTSISIEPFLDENPFILIKKLLPYVTESIWIGKMNYIKTSSINLDEEEYYKKIREINSKENLKKIIEFSKQFNIIKIKDSIYNYLSS